MKTTTIIILLIFISVVTFGQSLKIDQKLKLTPITEFDNNLNLIKFIQLNDSRTGYDTLIRRYDKNDNLIYQYVNAEKWVMNPTFEKKTVSKARTGSYSFEEILQYNANGQIKLKTRKDWKGYDRENESMKYIQYLYYDKLLIRQTEYDQTNSLILETSYEYKNNNKIYKITIDSTLNTLEEITYEYNRNDSLIMEKSVWKGYRNYLKEFKYQKANKKKKIFIKYTEKGKPVNRKEIAFYRNNKKIREIAIFPTVKDIRITNYTDDEQIKDEKRIDNFIGYLFYRITKMM